MIEKPGGSGGSGIPYDPNIPIKQEIASIIEQLSNLNDKLNKNHVAKLSVEEGLYFLCAAKTIIDTGI